MYWDERREDLTTKGLVRLGSVFARLRIAHGFSQQKLGERIGLSQASISRFENGKQPGLSARWLARMLIVLEVSPGALASRLLPPPDGGVDHRWG